MPLWYLCYGFKAQFLIYMVMLPGHFLLKASQLQWRRYIRKTRNGSQRKIKEQFLFLCCYSICCFFNSCFCEKQEDLQGLGQDSPTPTLTRLPLTLRKHFFFLASFHRDSRTLKRFGKEITFFYFLVNVVRGTTLGNLAEMILFDSHKKFWEAGIFSLYT